MEKVIRDQKEIIQILQKWINTLKSENTILHNLSFKSDLEFENNYWEDDLRFKLPNGFSDVELKLRIEQRGKISEIENRNFKLKKYPTLNNMWQYIGKECAIDGELEKTYTYLKNNNTLVKWKTYKRKEQKGIIVGFGKVYNGKLWKNLSWESGEDTQLINRKAVFFVLVCINPTQKPLKVKIENLEIKNFI